MQRVELSELTNRLRRNLMGAAFLIIVIAGFDIRVGKVLTSGVELENLTTEVVLVALLAFLIYHAIAFFIHAYEEYRLWELKPAEKAPAPGDGDHLELIGRMTPARAVLDRIKAILEQHDRQKDFTEEDFASLKETIEGALIYAKHFQNFPVITRIRFWVLDIGAAVLMVITAFLFWILPAGLFNCWLL